MKKLEAMYLGDGLYISCDGYQLKLMSGSHNNPDNEVYLDDGTLTSFLNVVNWLQGIEEKKDE